MDEFSTMDDLLEDDSIPADVKHLLMKWEYDEEYTSSNGTLRRIAKKQPARFFVEND